MVAAGRKRSRKRSEIKMMRLIMFFETLGQAREGARDQKNIVPVTR